MIGESIRAILFGGLPVAVFTFLVLQWSIASGRLRRFEDSKGLERQFKDHKKAKKAAKEEAKADAKKRKETGEEPEATAPKKPFFHRQVGSDLLHDKVMFFGGGFYGMMALFAYFVIEVGEIFQFLAVVFTPGAWFENLGFDLVIGFIINTFVNIGLAFAWFVSLPKYADIGNGWIWIAAAYGGYMAGLKLVSRKGDLVWAQLGVAANKGASVARENAAKLKAHHSAGKDED